MNLVLKLKPSEKQANAYFVNGNGPAILVLHAWWGLKPFFRKFCDRLAEQGFTVMAPDLFQGRAANTIEEAKALMASRNSELMGQTVKAAKDYLAAFHIGEPMGVIGFSMGAAWALVTAANESDIGAAVLFYGVDEVNYSQITASVLGHFAEEDDYEPLDGVEKMKEAMLFEGLDVTIHTYPKVGHWFVEEDRPEYNAAAAQLAWDRTIEFLKKNL